MKKSRGRPDSGLPVAKGDLQENRRGTVLSGRVVIGHGLMALNKKREDLD